MHESVAESLGDLRSGARRMTIAAAASAAGAVLLFPFAWRTGLPAVERWLLLIFTVLYLVLAAYRVLGSLQADRQIDLEERFVMFATGSGRLLHSLGSGGKVWRPSGIVHGIERVLAGEVKAADFERKTEAALRASLRVNIPPAVRVAVPVLLLVTGVWIRAALLSPSLRSITLFAVILPTLAGLAIAETWIALGHADMRRIVHRVAAGIAAWAAMDYDGRDASFHHRVLYRDRAEEAGFPT